MGLADYLAKNYLSADKPSKKRKRKHATSGLIIADEDDTLTGPSRATGSDDEFSPVIVGSSHAGSNRTTTWKTYGSTAPTNAEQAAADAILQDAAEEKASRVRDDDDAPAIVDEEGNYDGPTMANGAMAGLQTAAQVTAALKRKEKLEKKAMQEMGIDPEGKAQETVYRDASGRRIDVAMKRAEMRRKAEEEERKRLEDKEGAVGDVQRREKEGRRRELEDAKLLGVARYADDEELNKEMKEKGRWNDPMAQMVGTTTTGGKKKGRRKVYEGAAEPNRYGIKPGYRWDGVDRSNGFERKWFAARNKQQSTKELEYAWEMDE
ncbi:Pre-mRNA-splicing factor of RES complex-domain-containing protein [Elsinoe ampelina]|uniref:Pre-mRNA-splicing factor of RES complex-domain-containing protein n=1 Tax=Elsinoe ampelina TaxID=302913 RepID=A0A6A6GLF5_9PEZI|nr:Pre-mRNA-splicing factor of RES complex-domain-containing protein [Elsinoe ampelina]